MNVKAEKANALGRYIGFTNLAKLLQFIEVFGVIVLISWSLTRLPLVFKLSGEYLDVVFDPQITARNLDLEKPNLVEVFEDLSSGMMSNSAAVLHLIITVDVFDGERRRR
ncbi:hypothetical protein L6452_03372 [Arctium lappa]|uniref:Uncharacterized protein n=1 Tax=Arctium lappa TaxID=4217 RepID=A0ACB9FMJ4_ARCLA|nr:hypothetical protein L6452_03372 [Arctium lappa]